MKCLLCLLLLFVLVEGAFCPVGLAQLASPSHPGGCHHQQEHRTIPPCCVGSQHDQKLQPTNSYQVPSMGAATWVLEAVILAKPQTFVVPTAVPQNSAGPPHANELLRI